MRGRARAAQGVRDQGRRREREGPRWCMARRLEQATEGGRRAGAGLRVWDNIGGLRQQQRLQRQCRAAAGGRDEAGHGLEANRGVLTPTGGCVF